MRNNPKPGNVVYVCDPYCAFRTIKEENHLGLESGFNSESQNTVGYRVRCWLHVYQKSPSQLHRVSAVHMIYLWVSHTLCAAPLWQKL